MTIPAFAEHAQRPRQSRWFVLGYGAAQAGAYITFIPLLTLLLPLKAEALDPANKGILLAQVAMVGGIMASLANLVFGGLSDRTQSRMGRRRPWIFAGLAVVALSLALIEMVQSGGFLIAAIVVFQLGVNMVYAPLTALVPDMVPDDQKGLVSAWGGAALPVSTLFTATVVAHLTGWEAAPYLAVVAVAGVLILPFVIRLREPAPSAPAARTPWSIAALKDWNFLFAFGSRLLAEGAVALHTLYLLYLVQNLPEGMFPGRLNATGAFGVLLTAATLSAMVSGFAAGAVSDWLGRRRPLTVLGCVMMGAALAVMAGMPSWSVMVGAQILFGVGHGLHAPTVAAMTAEILPDPSQPGRDLGLMNVAVALPQFLGPGIAAVMLASGHPLNEVFYIAATAALGAALLLGPMRLGVIGRQRVPNS